MALSRKRLAGPGYIILNVLRAMNIIGLLAVVTASVVMLVNAFTTNISNVRSYIVTKGGSSIDMWHSSSSLTPSATSLPFASVVRSLWQTTWRLLAD